ncbi:YitT family protein [Geomicrobium sp. JCM 19038]|uniref:YczE/YyaS/YitT family protein n=1 Tax=Geomicrobium sp. JCM 19038 TaxID=1460635 RepID=UPI00045F1085|nr:YitT family protein [Geomicrobium sp. JCM 19038]GAK06921.1 integral membrane protein [Geomicrobium sp. JCM 19038]
MGKLIADYSMYGRTYFFKRLGLFLAGLLVMALGGSLMIQSSMGTATWDVLHIGLTNLTPLSIGAWVQIIGIIMIAIACWMEREWPQVGSILNIILVGLFLDMWLLLPIAEWMSATWQLVILLFIGIVLIGLGSGMYVSTRLGAGPRDGVTLAVAKRSGWSIRSVRTILEGCALLLGWLIGGPVAFGTFLSVFLIGPVMQSSLFFWRKQVAGWQDHATSIRQEATPIA